MLLRYALAVTMPAVVVWLLLAAAPGYLHAQDAPYRGKTVRVIVGFPSGGSSTMTKIIHG